MYKINYKGYEFNITQNEDGTFKIPNEIIDLEPLGTALKPANEPICVARKPLSEKSVAENVLKWGTGGINVDGCRVGTETHIVRGTNISGKIGEDQFNRVGDDRNFDGMNKEVEGRFPANIILECICDEVIKGEKGEVKSNTREAGNSFNNYDNNVGKVVTRIENYGDKGDIHTNPNCPCYLLDEQSGISTTKCVAGTIDKTAGIFQDENGNPTSGHKKKVYPSNINDKGGASRFFFKASYNFLEQKEYKMKNECQQNNYKLVQYVEQSGLNISQITKLIAQSNVTQHLKDKLVLLVKSALNLSEKCTMYIVANIVAIATENMASPLTQDFITELENYILIQNLAQIVEVMDNTDTTLTTQSLMKLFGSVLLVIEKHTQLDQEQEKEERKSEQLTSTYRFRYQAKVSKQERNMGLDGFEEVTTGGKGHGLDRRCSLCNTSMLKPEDCKCENPDWITPPKKNSHPCIKPINLMAYLCRLVTPKNGIVLDPFMGSGSTGIAAQLEEFRFCGMEMDENYFKIATARIESFEQYKKFIK